MEEDMKVLTIANRKGGAGKSTCAAHLAVEASKSGLKTIIVDMDPQKTLEGWWENRKTDDIQLLEVMSDELQEKVVVLREKGFDLCIIDTPGDVSENAISGILAADLVLIPSKPTAPDLSAIGRTINIVEQNKKKFVFVVTQAVSNTKSTFQASSVLSGFGAVAPSPISNRISYQRAMGQGGDAGEADKLAQEEISKVWGFVSNRLFEAVKNNKEKLKA